MPPNTKKCDHKEIGYVSNGGSGLHPVPVCKNCNASVFFKPTPTTEKEKCYIHSFMEAGGNCQYCGISSITTTSTPAVEDWEEATRKFANRLAMQLKPSNDTMAAIRLLHKELPSLIASLRESDRKRIDKELFEELAMDDPECEHGHFWQDCRAKKCDKRSMALLYKHLSTFITNLK